MISKYVSLNLVKLASIAALACVIASPLMAAAQTPYTVIAKWPVGGEGGWDYLAVDPAAPHLFLTHGTRVEIVDTGSGKVIGSIADLKGTHGVVFDNEDKYGYISDGRANEVVVFDRKTFDFNAVATLFVWVMTLFIQRSSRRDTLAIHAKLDELIRADENARSELTRLDEKEPEMIAKHRDDEVRALREPR